MLEGVGDGSRVGVRCMQQLASPGVELPPSDELGGRALWGPTVLSMPHLRYSLCSTSGGVYTGEPLLLMYLHGT